MRAQRTTCEDWQVRREHGRRSRARAQIRSRLRTEIEVGFRRSGLLAIACVFVGGTELRQPGAAGPSLALLFLAIISGAAWFAKRHRAVQRHAPSARLPRQSLRLFYAAALTLIAAASAGTILITVATALGVTFTFTLVLTAALDTVACLYFVDHFVYHFTERKPSRRHTQTDFFRLLRTFRRT